MAHCALPFVSYLCASYPLHWEMRKFLTAILSVAVISCGAGTPKGRTAPSEAPAAPVEPAQYTYTVRNAYPHSTASYTQGLQYIDGQLWEGTGEYGHSRLQRLDLATGRAEVVAELPRSQFGEGITVLGDRVYWLTWQSNTAHVYDRHTGEKLRDFRYPGEGWGLTSDGTNLYMSDGTEYLYTVDPDTFRRTRNVAVTYRGTPLRYLNELEWIDGKVWANVYTTDRIVIIDPATGVVEGVIDLTGLLPAEETTAETDVLNGIAYDAATGRIFVTGKRWDKLFEIELVKQ